MRRVRSILTALPILVIVAGISACNSDEDSTMPKGCVPVSARAGFQFSQNARYSFSEFKADAKTQSLPFEAPSHIPKAARAFADKGRLGGSNQLAVTIALGFNHEEELDQRLLEVYTPGTPNYRKFMTPEEFRARYAPTRAQIDSTEAFLRGQGIYDLRLDPNGYLLQAKASAQVLSSAFKTELRKYRDSSGSEYFAPAIEPSFPAGSSIRAVHGLSNLGRFKSHVSISRAARSAQAQPGQNAFMSPDDIRSAYRIPRGVSAAGQTIAVIALDGYVPSDVSNYWNSFGLSPIPLQNILIDGATGAAGSSSTETTLDIELVSSVAQGADRILVYQAPNQAQAVLDLYSRIANDNIAKVITTSWGGPESMQSTSFLISESAILKQMALQGQTVFAAAGDAGAYSDQKTLSVIDPASQPFVVGVGGTRLSMNGGAYFSETTWNGGTPTQGAGGGGVSALWAQPAWQNGISSASNRGSGGMRNVPDVSLNSDPASGYAIFAGGRWISAGGTSAATPIWAGFTALVNRQRQVNGLGPVGFLNPRLYSIGRGGRYALDFNDIRDGSTNLYYPAVPGYDNATGWGTLNGQGMFQDLSTDSTDTSGAVSC